MDLEFLEARDNRTPTMMFTRSAYVRKQDLLFNPLMGKRGEGLSGCSFLQVSV